MYVGMTRTDSGQVRPGPARPTEACLRRPPAPAAAAGRGVRQGGSSLGYDQGYCALLRGDAKLGGFPLEQRAEARHVFKPVADALDVTPRWTRRNRFSEAQFSDGN